MRQLLLVLALVTLGSTPLRAIATSAPLAPAATHLRPVAMTPPLLRIAVDTVPDLTPAEERELRRLERAEGRARGRGGRATATPDEGGPNPAAIAAMALGGGAVLLLALSLAADIGILSLVALVAFILAIVFGATGLKRAKRRGLRQRGLALGGLITGIVGVGLYLIGFIALLIFVLSFGR